MCMGAQLNVSNLPDHAESQQELPQDRLVRLVMDVATFCDMCEFEKPELKSFDHIKLLNRSWPPFHGYPPPL